MNGRIDARASLTMKSTAEVNLSASIDPVSISAGPSPSQAGARRSRTCSRQDPALVLMVSASPSAASAADGDELGTVIAAWGDPDELLVADRRAPRPHLRLHAARRRRRRRRSRCDRRRLVGLPVRCRRADRAHRRAGAPRSVRALPPAAPARRAGRRRLLGGDVGRRARGGRRARVCDAPAPPCSRVVGALTVACRGSRSASSWWATCPRSPLRDRDRVPPRHSSWPGSSFTRWVAARRGIFVALAAMRCGAILAILARRGGARLAGGRDPARGRRAARRWPLLRDAEHRDRHRARVGVVRRAPHPRGDRLPAPRRVRARRRFAVDRCELRRCDHPLRGRRPVARRSAAAGVGGWSSSSWGATTAIGMAAIAVMHRYLTDRPTHVTAFLEEHHVPRRSRRSAGRSAGDRVRSADRHPLAAIPVVGVLVLLVVVLRPPAGDRRELRGPRRVA